VSGAPVSECTPPNEGTGHDCYAFDRMIRANFTPRQIGMLFGHSTSYPESLTGGNAATRPWCSNTWLLSVPPAAPISRPSKPDAQPLSDRCPLARPAARGVLFYAEPHVRWCGRGR